MHLHAANAVAEHGAVAVPTIVIEEELDGNYSSLNSSCKIYHIFLSKNELDALLSVCTQKMMRPTSTR